MKKIILLFTSFILLYACSEKVQQPITMEPEEMEEPMIVLNDIGQFPPIVNECSGLIKVGDRIIAMNDGSTHTLLQEIDPIDASVTDTISIDQIGNVDWEALQYDSDNIYIADVGNNEGDRQQLSLYIVPYLEEGDMICTDTINFIWPDQTNFESTTFHPYDCEAMLIEGDEAVFFSKSRTDFKSNVYRLDFNTKEVTKEETIELFGMVTDAAHDPSGEVILLSYFPTGGGTFNNNLHFVSVTDGVYSHKSTVSLGITTQVEALVHIENHKYLIGAESESSEGGRLYSLDLSEFYP